VAGAVIVYAVIVYKGDGGAPPLVHADDFLRQFIEAIRRLDAEERANLVTLLLRVLRRKRRDAGGQCQAMSGADNPNPMET